MAHIIGGCDFAMNFSIIDGCCIGSHDFAMVLVFFPSFFPISLFVGVGVVVYWCR
ncbi:hypothetical protein C2G38_2176870 [Gigaspora rosea]|uniref:Transmembrane protein n=1 Tax=Gigaspora rosea TaxID=44941 RepID=A0A397VHQ5_9GLOM|nr:hypothetical protein C2G38_2176870 [Gigaspora rosea]